MSDDAGSREGEAEVEYEAVRRQRLALLVEDCSAFLRAGGVLTYGDWKIAAAEERAALIVAQRVASRPDPDYLVACAVRELARG